MKRSFLWGLFFLLAPSLASAQEGGSAAAFLGIVPDARSAALGGSGITRSADAYSIFRNAAQSVFSENRGEFGYGYVPWMRDRIPGSFMQSAGGFFRFAETQAVSAGFRYLSHARTLFTDENGNPLKRVRPCDLAVDAAYSRLLLKNLSVSFTARYLRSDLGGGASADAVACDIGLFFRRTIRCGRHDPFWALGLRIGDLGTGIDYGYGRHFMPWRIDLGAAAGMTLPGGHGIGITAGTDLRRRSSDAPLWGGSVGAEYDFRSLFSVRGGYRMGGGADCSYGSVGCGLRINRFVLDAAYLLTPGDSPLRDTWYLTLRMRLGREH